MTDVSTPSPAIVRQAARIELINALMGGTHAMREAGERFLPRMPAESVAAYRNRLESSTLFNAARRTVSTLTGKVFKTPPAIGADVPPVIAAMLEDVDRCGTRFDVFARELFEAALADGLTHILVDHPGQPPGRTLADERAARVRPYMIHVKQSQIIGYKTAIANGVTTLTQLRYREQVEVADGEYASREVAQIRVLMPGKYELWRQDADSGAWKLHDIGETSLDFIPWVTVFFGRRLGPFEAEPPLDDIAHLNAAHWRSSSDQTHVLHVARVPILFGSGWGDDEDGDDRIGSIFELGPNRLLTGPADADLRFVEHSGAAIEAGRQDLQDIEARMAVAGLELLVKRPGDYTATARAIDSAEADSALAAMAMNLEDGLERALGLMARWIGLGNDAGGSVSINKDFGLPLNAANEIAALIELRSMREISFKTLITELKRRRFLADAVEAETEQAQIDDDPLPRDAGGFDRDATR